MRRYFVLTMIMLCQMVQATPAPQSDVPGTIRISTELWPGYTEQNYSGAYFDLVRLVYQPYATQLQISFSNYNRALNLVRQGKADLTLAVSAHSAHHLLLSARPMDQDQIMAIYLKDQQQINQITDLAPLRLAWNLAYDYGVILGLTNAGYEVTSEIQGIELLVKKRIDVYLAEKSQYEFYLANHKFSAAKLTAHPIAKDVLYAAFADTVQGEQLKAIWDQRIEALLQSGELQQLYQQYNDFSLLKN